jgi:hypothetical protein
MDYLFNLNNCGNRQTMQEPKVSRLYFFQNSLSNVVHRTYPQGTDVPTKNNIMQIPILLAILERYRRLGNSLNANRMSSEE